MHLKTENTRVLLGQRWDYDWRRGVASYCPMAAGTKDPLVLLGTSQWKLLVGEPVKQHAMDQMGRIIHDAMQFL